MLLLTKKRFFVIFFIFTLQWLWLSVVFASQPIPLFDSHSHYKTADAQQLSPQQLINLMDRHHITKMVIVGEPPDRVQDLYQKYPQRIIPFLGLYKNHLDKARWMNNADLVSELEIYLQNGYYAGIGEIHIFKKDKTHPNFKKLVSLADKYDLPVLLHGDAEVVEQVFEWYPGMTVIWAHLGTIPEPESVNRVLLKYRQGLYIDTSVRDERLVSEGRLKSEWKAVFMRFPERFLVGIDTFYTPRWIQIGQVTKQIRAWLQDLPEDVASKLAYQNAQQLFQAY